MELPPRVQPTKALVDQINNTHVCLYQNNMITGQEMTCIWETDLPLAEMLHSYHLQNWSAVSTWVLNAVQGYQIQRATPTHLETSNQATGINLRDRLLFQVPRNNEAQ